LEAGPAVADALLGRAASFHADAILEEDSSMRSLFSEYRGAVVKEILAGVPFSGALTGLRDANEPTVDMRFAWWHSGLALNTSFFVSGLTTLQYTFGLTLAVVAGIGSGFLIGRISRKLLHMPLAESWLLVQAAMLTVALIGLQKADFLRIIINMLLYYGAVRMVSRRKISQAEVRTT
jgi:hypothetical protein